MEDLVKYTHYQWFNNDENENKLLSASQDGKLLIWNIQKNRKSLAIPLRSRSNVINIQYR